MLNPTFAPKIGLAIVAGLVAMFSGLMIFWIDVSTPVHPAPTSEPLAIQWVGGPAAGSFAYERHVKVDYWGEIQSEEWQVIYHPPQGDRELVMGFRERVAPEKLRVFANTQLLTVIGPEMIHERPLGVLPKGALWDLYLLPFWKAFADTGISVEGQQSELCVLQTFTPQRAVFECKSKQAGALVQLSRAGGEKPWSTVSVLEKQSD